MKRIGVVIFWVLCAVFAIPAVVGVTLLCVTALAAMLLGLAAILVALAVVIILCIPMIWLCGTWDGTAAQSLMAKIKASQPKVPLAHQ
jgi:membrane protein YdbS with pleckstrin-like domain